MSYPHTIQAGIESLREIEQLLKQFSHDGYIPSLDLDLILQKTRNLYEVLILLRQYQSSPNDNSGIEHSPGTPKVDSRSVSQELHQAEKTDTSKTVTEARARVSDIPLSVPDIMDEKPEKKILSERFIGRPSLYDSIHDTALQKNGVPLGQVKPVSTIIAAIGINDRYTFVRELFNNDPSAFERAIINLDEATDFNTAYNYLTDHFDWDMGSETVQTLLDIIRRKHIKARDE